MEMMVSRRHPPPILTQRQNALITGKPLTENEQNGVFEFGRLVPDIWEHVSRARSLKDLCSAFGQDMVEEYVKGRGEKHVRYMR